MTISAPASLSPETLVTIESAAAMLAQQAGALLLERFRTRLTVEYKSAGHQDPVTEADREAERFLRQAILARFPEHGVLGEEGSEPPREAAAPPARCATALCVTRIRLSTQSFLSFAAARTDATSAGAALWSISAAP